MNYLWHKFYFGKSSFPVEWSYQLSTQSTQHTIRRYNFTGRTVRRPLQTEFFITQNPLSTILYPLSTVFYIPRLKLKEFIYEM